MATSISDLQKLFLKVYQGQSAKILSLAKLLPSVEIRCRVHSEMYCIFGSLCPSTQYVRKAVDYVTTKIQLPGDCLALEIKSKCWSLVLPVLPFLPTNRMPTCRIFIWQCFISLPVWEGHLFENLFKNKTTCLCAMCK